MTETATRPPASKPSDAAKYTRIGLIAAVAVAIAAWALWPRAVGVDVGSVSAGPMTVRIEEEGKTRIKDVFIVSAPQAGIVLRSPLVAGDAVAKGTTLVALLQPAQPPFLDLRTRLEVMAQVKAAEAAIKLADAEFVQARSNLAFAQAEATRARTLAANNTISERAREKAEHEGDVARAALAKAEANIAVKQRQLQSVQARLVNPEDETLGGLVEAACCVEVRAPVTGRVLRVHQTSEQVLPAGTPLAEIGDPKLIEIVVELLSTDVVQIVEGARVDIDGWGGAETLTGIVRRIEAAGFTKVSALGIEEQRVRVIIDLDDASRARHHLGHEFRVMAHIHVWENARVPRLPVGALFRYQSDWAVFRVTNGRARRVAVRLGHRNDDYAEVLAGLDAGDRVVLHPSDKVSDGVRVSARAPSAAAVMQR